MLGNMFNVMMVLMAFQAITLILSVVSVCYCIETAKVLIKLNEWTRMMGIR